MVLLLGRRVRVRPPRAYEYDWAPVAGTTAEDDVPPVSVGEELRMDRKALAEADDGEGEGMLLVCPEFVLLLVVVVEV